MSNTAPKAADLQLTIQRRMGGAARLRLALDMSLFAREFAKARIRLLNPDFTEEQVSRALLSEAMSQQTSAKRKS